MLIITDLNGNTEALSDVKNVEVNEEVNGDFSISFTSFYTEKNAHSYPIVQEESIVELDGHEFRVKKLNEIRNQKTVSAQHVFFDLIDHYVYSYIGGTKSIDEVFQFILDGTGWTFENVDVSNQELLTNFGEDNALSLIRKACEGFQCEIKIEPNRHIKIFKEIGQDNDVQFRYKHNIKTVKRSVDTSKLTTVIKGYGGNGLEVEYRSPNVSVYGEKHAEPVRDERYTIAESMIERLKKEINDVPEVSIEVEASLLGYDADLGDKVWLIYEPLNIDFQTRIMARKWFPFSRKSPTVTLVNKKQSSITDLLTQTKIEIKENQKETRSKIEQTNEKITLEVERVDESIASIQLQTDNIQLNVSSLDSRMGSAESQLSIHAGQISSKVSQTDYNGNTIASLINQSATTVYIEASKINLTGAVTLSALAADTNSYLNGINENANNAYSLASTANQNANNANNYVQMWKSPSSTYINGAYIATNTIQADKFYGNIFTVGNGVTTTKLEFYTSDSSGTDVHYIKSTGSYGFGIISNSSLALRADSRYGIYTKGAPLVVQSGFRVDGGITQFNTDVYMGNGTTLWVKDIWRNGSAILSVAELQSWFSPLGHTHSSLNGFYFYSGSNPELQFPSYAMWRATSNELQARDYWGSSAIGVAGAGFRNNSQRSMKKNITDYVENALPKIVNAKTYQFHFLNESDDKQKHLGLILDEAPPEIVWGEGIDLYAMITMAWKAIQELNQKIEGVKQIA